MDLYDHQGGSQSTPLHKESSWSIWPWLEIIIGVMIDHLYVLVWNENVTDYKVLHE